MNKYQFDGLMKAAMKNISEKKIGDNYFDEEKINKLKINLDYKTFEFFLQAIKDFMIAYGEHDGKKLTSDYEKMSQYFGMIFNSAWRNFWSAINERD